MKIDIPYRVEKTDLAHIYRVDLHNNGVGVECAVLSVDTRTGDLHFMRIDHLGEIDRARLLKIVSRRDAAKYPLWDLLSQNTLGNGMNALEFFHQFALVKSMSGVIRKPNAAVRGVSYSHPNFQTPSNGTTTVGPQPTVDAPEAPTKAASKTKATKSESGSE